MKTIWKFAFLLILSLLSTGDVFAQIPAQRIPRITRAVDETDRVTLKGNTHPLARAKYDQGPALDSMPMQRMLLVLQRSADQETALRTLLDEQQTKASANFHKWLTPDEFGQQFGPAEADVQVVSDWLKSHGFEVTRISAGRTIIEFSGNVAQVREAFGTEIHKYVVNGEEHWANASDPQIPAALAPVVAGVNSLHNFRKKPLQRKVGVFQREKSTGRVTPLFSFQPPGGASCGLSLPTCNALSPGDFAIIYNLPTSLNPNYKGVPLDGSGQTIAIVGDSQICTASSPDFGECSEDDVAKFRSLFALDINPNSPNLPQIIIDGPDPFFFADETEADLDSQWAGGVAPGAKILLVIALDTETTSGVDLAAEHIVDNNLAGILSESFGACEPALGNSGNIFYSSLWEQAAAQGISVSVSAGDNGSAGCDNENLPSPNLAQSGTFVNGIASTGFDVAVGGTDFDSSVANYQSMYWGSNSATNVSAKSPIPETTWNDSCAQNGLVACAGLAANSPLLNIVGGSGGPSNCTVQNAAMTQCLNGYPKPSWQTGSNVPNDMARDVPDLSLFASDGLKSGSFYLICESDLNPGGSPCNLSAPFTDFVGVGGTSSSAPAFAGILALINQQMATAGNPAPRQGNPNYVLYPLAAAQNYANCNSSTGPAAGCVFNDITKGNNSVPCMGGSQNCSTAAGTGVLFTMSNGTQVPAFGAGTGYDLATGLGSVNGTNLVAAWVSAVGKFTPTVTTLNLNGSTNPLVITHGTAVMVSVKVTANTTPTGDVSLIGTCLPANPNCFNEPNSNTAGADRFTANINPNTGSYVISNVDFFTLSGGSASGATTALMGCTPPAGVAKCQYNLTAHYAGDGVHGASDSPPILVEVDPEGSATALSVLQLNLLMGGTSTVSNSTAPYGSALFVRVDVTGSSSQQENATGNVTITDNGSNLDGGTFLLNAEGYTEVQTPNLSFLGKVAPNGIVQYPALPAGMHSFAASYQGDGSYRASSTLSPVALTVTRASTFASLSSNLLNVGAGQNFTLTALVDTSPSPSTVAGSVGNAPSGMVTFCTVAVVPCPAGNILGTPQNLSAVSGGDANGWAESQATLNTSLQATATIAAQYSGDANYVASLSGAVTVTVAAADFSIVATTSTAMPIRPGGNANYTITITPLNGFNGTVIPSCAVTLNSAPTNLVTCGAFNPSPITLASNYQSVVVISATSGAFLPPAPQTRPGWPWKMIIWELAAFLTMIAAGMWIAGRAGISSKKRRLAYLAAAGLVLFIGLQLAGCGGGGGGGSGGGTPPRSYTITFTGTSGALSHSVSTTLTVQ